MKCAPPIEYPKGQSSDSRTTKQQYLFNIFHSRHSCKHCTKTYLPTTFSFFAVPLPLITTATEQWRRYYLPCWGYYIPPLILFYSPFLAAKTTFFCTLFICIGAASYMKQANERYKALNWIGIFSPIFIFLVKFSCICIECVCVVLQSHIFSFIRIDRILLLLPSIILFSPPLPIYFWNPIFNINVSISQTAYCGEYWIGRRKKWKTHTLEHTEQKNVWSSRVALSAICIRFGLI